MKGQGHFNQISDTLNTRHVFQKDSREEPDRVALALMIATALLIVQSF